MIVNISRRCIVFVLCAIMLCALRSCMEIANGVVFLDGYYLKQGTSTGRDLGKFLAVEYDFIS